MRRYSKVHLKRVGKEEISEKKSIWGREGVPIGGFGGGMPTEVSTGVVGKVGGL